MAVIVPTRKKEPTTISRFLGLNEDTTGETEIKLGESADMTNWRITETYKLKKREGYTSLFTSLGAFNIRGIWTGTIAGVSRFLFAANGNIYSRSGGVNTSIGTMTDAATTFFAFDDKVYMLNGVEYKSWDGTTFGDVAGYVPLIATATPPAGGGTDDESLNLLTGKKRQKFSGDGTSATYQLRETSIDSVDAVYVDGVLQTVTTDYTVNLTNGTVSPVTPADFTSGTDNIEIYWTKGSGSRPEIVLHKYVVLFGGKNDTRVHFYGDGSNKWYYSGLADGVPSAEYFPTLNYREVGSQQYDITAMIRQYDRLLIYTNGGETYYSYYDALTIDGETVPDFPTFTLNETVGHVAPGQAQLIENNPFTIQSNVWQWVATNVRDERNAENISKRVQPSLDEFDLTTALTVDWEEKQEYWLAVGTTVLVFNYRLNVWYKFLLSHTPTCFHVSDGVMYFGTSGEIMQFDTGARTDDGETITATWEMNMYDFETEWLLKTINRMWISIQPGGKQKLKVSWQTNNKASTTDTTLSYENIDFSSMDFSDFSFETFTNPQPFRLKIKAKKFVYFKVILTNDYDDASATVLSINLLSRTGGETK